MGSGIRASDHRLARAPAAGRDRAWPDVLLRGSIAGLVLAVHGGMLLMMLRPAGPAPPPPAQRAHGPAAWSSAIEVRILPPAPARASAPPPPSAPLPVARPSPRADMVARAAPAVATPPQVAAPTRLPATPRAASTSAPPANIDDALRQRVGRWIRDSQRRGTPRVPGAVDQRSDFAFVRPDQHGVKRILKVISELTTPPSCTLADRARPPTIDPIAAADGKRAEECPQPGGGVAH